MLTRNSLPSSLPSFNMVGETGREGNMAHRAERRRSERAGRYWAGSGAQGAGEFCVVATILHNLCR